MFSGSIPARGNHDSNADSASPSLFDDGVFGDSVSGTLADVAMYYYERDLHPVLTDKVPTSERDRALADESAFDLDGEVMHQHMKTYTIGFGVEGSIDAAAIPTDFTLPFAWPDAFAGGENKIDDMLHAAVNGRGQFLQANNPVLLSEAFQAAFEEFSEGSVSVSAVAFNSVALREGTLVFRGFFNLKHSSGDLKALTIEEDPGDPSGFSTTEVWSAADRMDGRAPTVRVIATWDDTASGGGTGVPFRFDDLNADQLAVLSSAQVDYLRGDRASEEPVGPLRAREVAEGLIGDIVHSAPQFVGSPRAVRRDAEPYPSTPGAFYAEFAEANRSRQALVYVGANDGMLHAFDAATGEEHFAYVPNKVIDASEGGANLLDQFTNPLYSHKFFVDLTPVAEDIYMTDGFGRDWRTVLIGGLGAGGKGYFALDVTDPAALDTEAELASQVLWEFTDEDDTDAVDGLGAPILDGDGNPTKDLGFTLSAPQVVMTNITTADGSEQKWAAFFGNGYNATAGVATLFALFVEDGVDGWDSGDVIKLSSLEGPMSGQPNGLSTPVMIDTDRNGTADLGYAGDIFGNLYRFDVRSDDVDDWSVKRIFTAAYAGVRQPITVQPYVIEQDPLVTGEKRYMVVFGTGSWVTELDGTSDEIQSVYGIWDNVVPIGETDPYPPRSKSELIEQSVVNLFVDDGSTEFERQRVIPDAGTNESGWFFDFDMQRAATTTTGDPNPDTSGNAPPAVQYPGERAVRRIIARGDIILITTVIPRDADACFPATPGSSFPIDPLNGSSPGAPVLDVTLDGVIDAADLVSVAGAAYSSGILFDSDDLDGTIVDPSVLIGSGRDDFLFLSGGADRLIIRIAGPGDQKTGRLSWREIDLID